MRQPRGTVDRTIKAGSLTKVVCSVAVIAGFASMLAGCGSSTTTPPEAAASRPTPVSKEPVNKNEPGIKNGSGSKDTRNESAINEKPATSVSTEAPEKPAVPVSAPAEKLKQDQAAPRLAFQTPGFDAWVKKVAAMPAEKQVEAVTQKLMEFGNANRVEGHRPYTLDDVNVDSAVENGVVTAIGFNIDVTDISPVRALAGLQSLRCGHGRLADLSPLKGMKLKELLCSYTDVSDLSALRGMPLTTLYCTGTKVKDLSPLREMPLSDLDFSFTEVSDLTPLKDMKFTALSLAKTQVSDLSPLKNMPLTRLGCTGAKVADLSPLKGLPLKKLVNDETAVSDLSPLKGLPLEELDCIKTQVSDLSPLKGMKLTQLHCEESKVTDLSPLRGVPLTDLSCDFKPERDTEILRSINTLTWINGGEAEKFWKKVNDGKQVEKP